MAAILAKQACLLLFGWALTILATVMLAAVGLLLRAQRRSDRASCCHEGPVDARTVSVAPRAW